MKNGRKLLALLLALLLLAALAGCGGGREPAPADPDPAPNGGQEPDPAPGGATAVTVTDMLGREITLEKPAERIVALTASDCEILYALGAGDRLVGRGEYCNYPEEALDIPAVQSGAETNLEQIIALEPDVVLMNKMDQPKEQVEALEESGIDVVLSDANDIAGTYVSIALIGAVTGRTAEAEALVAGMKSAFEEISAGSAGNSGKTVYFEVSPLEYGLWTSGKGTYMDEIAGMLGVTNIFADVDGWAQVSEEQVLERDPDYIVTITMYYGEGPTPVEEILGRSGWQDMTAIKNGAVINANSDEISRPGPRLVDAARALGEFFGD